MNLIEPILADAAAVTAIRRDIHAHPFISLLSVTLNSFQGLN